MIQYGARMQSLMASIVPKIIRAAGLRTMSAVPSSQGPPTVPVFVDDQQVNVPQGSTVLQACEAAGIDVPRFCYHERLSVAGNCRMCLVEVEKVPKPVASCAWPLQPNMRIKTDTPMVHKAREGVMEFLLANHPLDCPICDQGGECDLQDQSLYFGSDRSRFREIKRTVEDKDLGPIVKTVMTRCIHCTRCVRFAEEVAGVPTLGVTGRGNSMEIGTYTPKVFDSELSGNVVDLCPVGALTSKPYAFKARPWELKSTESIDVMDAVGSNIRLDARGPDVLRVLPRLNEDINEEWISDKTRYAIDGLERQRLDTPMVRDSVTGALAPASWEQAFDSIKRALYPLQPNDLKAIAGDMADTESMLALKDMFSCLGSSNFVFSDSTVFSADFREQYLFNATIVGIEKADFVLLVGSNPRMEAAIINARIRKINMNNDVPVYAIGPEADLAIPTKWLGNDYSHVKKLLEKSHAISAQLEKAKRPLIVLGTAAFSGPNALIMNEVVAGLQKAYPNLVQTDGAGDSAEWRGVSILHTSAARVGALDIGFVPGPSALLHPKKPKFVYLLGADSLEVQNEITKDMFVVYQGHNGDIGANLASVVLPSAAYTEKSATYVNMEGRTQRTLKAADVKGLAREDWKVIRALSEVLGVQLPYDSLEGIARRMMLVAPHLVNNDFIERPSVRPPNEVVPTQVASKLRNAPFERVYDNHFMTNSISRASETMAKTSVSLPISRNSYVSQ